MRAFAADTLQRDRYASFFLPDTVPPAERGCAQAVGRQLHFAPPWLDSVRSGWVEVQHDV